VKTQPCHCIGRMKHRDCPRHGEEVRAAISSRKAPPTSGFYKLGPSAQAAARSRAKAFYPFD
jgi:hypothetical protein